ncbi:MAG: CDP-alcohol phosphatidyltransferase family protein [Chlamydiales bacterium]
MKKPYLIPNAITAFGLSCGLFVIFKTSLVDPTRDLFSILQASAILLLIAAIADLADGAIARLIRAESEFGGQFDSLSDCVTFGVAPPLLVLKSFANEDLGRLLTFFVIIASMIYALCGVLRLVRYNIRAQGVDKPEAALVKNKHFVGLPIPAAAAGAVSTALIMVSPFVEETFALSTKTRALILIGVLLVLGYFMVSRWKFPSIKALHFRVPSFYLVIATGVVAVLFLYGILDFFAEAFFIASWLYLLISWTLSIIRLVAGKRSKTLADFEPYDEEE